MVSDDGPAKTCEVHLGLTNQAKQMNMRVLDDTTVSVAFDETHLQVDLGDQVLAYLPLAVKAGSAQFFMRFHESLMAFRRMSTH